jgi:hypothetical protein
MRNPVISRTLSPSRPCGSVTASFHGGPQGVAPLRHHTARRDNSGVAHARRKPPIAAQWLVMRCLLASFRLPARASRHWRLVRSS